MTRSISQTLGRLAGLAVVLTLTAGAAQAATAAQLDPAIDGYLAVHAALFADDLGAAQAAATRLATTAKDHPDLARAAAAIAAAKDLDGARDAFGDTSKALIVVVAAHPEVAGTLHAFRCPMVKGYQKWIQRVDSIQNPYMGQRMPRCGTHAPLAP